MMVFCRISVILCQLMNDNPKYEFPYVRPLMCIYYEQPLVMNPLPFPLILYTSCTECHCPPSIL